VVVGSVVVRVVVKAVVVAVVVGAAVVVGVVEVVPVVVVALVVVNAVVVVLPVVFVVAVVGGAVVVAASATPAPIPASAAAIMKVRTTGDAKAADPAMRCRNRLLSDAGLPGISSMMCALHLLQNLPEIAERIYSFVGINSPCQPKRSNITHFPHEYSMRSERIQASVESTQPRPFSGIRTIDILAVNRNN